MGDLGDLQMCVRMDTKFPGRLGCIKCPKKIGLVIVLSDGGLRVTKMSHGRARLAGIVGWKK